MSYADKLRDPRWQKKRLEIMNRDGWQCTGCRCGTKTLNVHHRYYKSGAEPWEYPDEALVTLCEDCHQDHHIIETVLTPEDVAREYRIAEHHQAMVAATSREEQVGEMLGMYLEISKRSPAQVFQMELERGLL